MKNKTIMKTKKGSTVAEMVLVLLFAVIFGAFVFSKFFNEHVVGNKQYFDFKQTFNTAYVDMGGTNTVRYTIAKWKDYENSDSVQIVLPDGHPIYTHLSRVVLTKE